VTGRWNRSPPGFGGSTTGKFLRRCLVKILQFGAFWQESVLLIRIIGSQRYSLDPTSKLAFGESDVSRIISYSYHYRLISRLTLSYGIREVINPRNLVFPPAEICAVDVEFSFQNGRGESVCAWAATRNFIGRQERLAVCCVSQSVSRCESFGKVGSVATDQRSRME